MLFNGPIFLFLLFVFAFVFSVPFLSNFACECARFDFFSLLQRTKRRKQNNGWCTPITTEKSIRQTRKKIFLARALPHIAYYICLRECLRVVCRLLFLLINNSLLGQFSGTQTVNSLILLLLAFAIATSLSMYAPFIHIHSNLIICSCLFDFTSIKLNRFKHKLIIWLKYHLLLVNMLSVRFVQ